MGQGQQKIPAKKFWEKADKDRSGYLTVQELRGVLKDVWTTYKIKTPVTEFQGQIIDDLDVNNDGKITMKEFQNEYDDAWDEVQKDLEKRQARMNAKAKAKQTPTPKTPAPKSPKKADQQQAKASTGRAAASSAPTSPGPKPPPQGTVAKKKTAPPPASTMAKAAPGKAASTAYLRCPHCAFEIDPRQLHRLRVPPEALGVTPAPFVQPQVLGRMGGSPGYPVAPQAIAAAPVPPGTKFNGPVPSSFFQSSHGWWAQAPRQASGSMGPSGIVDV